MKLTENEYKFASIIWDNEPLPSGELVKLCAEKLNWKKSTTYTILKKLSNAGVFKNENSTVYSIIKREDVQKHESKSVINGFFNGSLPRFITAFLDNENLDENEIEEIKRVIESYKGGE